MFTTADLPATMRPDPRGYHTCGYATCPLNPRAEPATGVPSRGDATPARR